MTQGVCGAGRFPSVGEWPLDTGEAYGGFRKGGL